MHKRRKWEEENFSEKNKEIQVRPQIRVENLVKHQKKICLRLKRKNVFLRKLQKSEEFKQQIKKKVNISNKFLCYLQYCQKSGLFITQNNVSFICQQWGSQGIQIIKNQFKKGINTFMREQSMSQEQKNQKIINILMAMQCQNQTKKGANQIVIPRSPCLVCDKYIYNQMKVEPKSDFGHIIFIISQQVDLNTLDIVLKKTVNAILNSGSGIIFITNKSVQQINDGETNLIGNHYPDQSQRIETLNKWNQYLSTFKTFFTPKFKHQFSSVLTLVPQFVRVVQNPSLPADHNFEENTFILRIVVRNQISEAILYNTSVQGFENKYFLNLGTQNKVYEITGKALYNFLVQSHYYYKNFKFRSFCYSNLCSSLPELQDFIEQFISQSQLSENDILESQNFQMKYRHNSIIIISSHKYNSLINTVKQQFQHNKYKCDIFQPFKSYRQKSGRQVWLISHDEKFQQIRKVVKKFDEKKKALVIHISKSLIIHRKYQEHDQLWQEFRTKLKIKFDEQINPIQEQRMCKGSLVEIDSTYINFSCLKVCLFSFLFLQDNRVKSQFVTQNSKKIHNKI